MECVWVDFKAVKQTVSMEMAVACYGVMLRRIDRTYLRGRCPLPTHRSKSSSQTFIMNTDKNAWACHSDSCAGARGGRIGGNVLDFVAAMESCSIRHAALKLQEWFTVTAELPKAPTPVHPPGCSTDYRNIMPGGVINRRQGQQTASIHAQRHRLLTPLPRRKRDHGRNGQTLWHWLLSRQGVHARQNRRPDSK